MAIGSGFQSSAKTSYSQYFAVTQALVKLLATHGGQSLTETKVEEKILTSPLENPSQCPLMLANALAACVISIKLCSNHRQWAAQQLVSKINRIEILGFL